MEIRYYQKFDHFIFMLFFKNFAPPWLRASYATEYTNGSIKEQQFLKRGRNKFSCSHRGKKEGTSMWNAWVLCVFVLYYHGNWREAGLQLLCHVSWGCFVNKVMIPDIMLSQRALPQMISGSEIHHWFICFLCKTLLEILRSHEINIYVFKVKKKSTRTRP